MDCQICNKPLEVDAKFCTHCGASVSEEKVLKMNEEKPIPKIKLYTYQTISLFIALILSFIIKVFVGFLFSAMNISKLSAVLDAVGAISGLMLFFGIWYLLSGISLKNAKHKTRGYNLIAAYAIVVFIVVIFADKTN